MAGRTRDIEQQAMESGDTKGGFGLLGDVVICCCPGPDYCAEVLRGAPCVNQPNPKRRTQPKNDLD